MSILLVSFHKSINYDKIGNREVLGIRYLAAYMVAKGIKADIMDQATTKFDIDALVKNVVVGANLGSGIKR